MEEWESCPDGEHDWRVDPEVILLTYPPQRRIVCATCGDISSSSATPKWKPPSRDPRTWERL